MPDLEPITRLEEYLSKLAGDDVAVPEPITRVEKFLAYIAGEADSKPTPITRIEKFLDAIGQGGGGGGGETVIVPEQAVEAIESSGLYQADIGSAWGIVPGLTYVVGYDGVEYELVATMLMGAPVLGEGDDQGPDFTNYPFVFMDVGADYLRLYASTGGEHTVKITLLGGGSATLITKTINTNGTYDASDDDADGYSEVTVSVPNTYTAGDEGKVVSSGALVSQTAATYTANSVYDTTLIDEVTVNVSGGGASPLTLLYEDEVTVNTTSTSSTDIKSISHSFPALGMSEVLVAVVYDKAGARSGYFYYSYARAVAYGNLSSAMVWNDGGARASNNNPYGVYWKNVTTDGGTIAARYSSGTGTIDGTYVCKVYKLDISALV